jgi:hypothetical protein
MFGSFPSRVSSVKYCANTALDSNKNTDKKIIFHAIDGSVNAFLGCNKIDEHIPDAPRISPDNISSDAADRPIMTARKKVC